MNPCDTTRGDGRLAEPQRRLVVYSGPSALKTDVAVVRPLLDVCVKEWKCDGVYVYRFDRTRSQLERVASGGALPAALPSFSAGLSMRDSHWLLHLKEAFAVAPAASEDRRLQAFPEFVEFGFASAISVPLRVAGRLIGVMNLCRRLPTAFGQQELASAMAMSGPLAALLTRAEVREENRDLVSEVERIQRKLDDRKVIDRAKGVLQHQSGCTEEAAYYTLRATSRRLRQPMRRIAEIVIQQGRLPDTGPQT
jgi:GAF domain-containing protein